ncbi:MAG TPA: nitrilase-related carbon-nitrogen hydrolase [Dyella sp.]|uniref:nitrilase-related carbon-nitrogen hydrolase n=1 Tax=Dyella sp. TaxID=1869338 RepID=UPI002D78E13C|nr:nitrilase-related carbon-nitrogen hydrolase [Dyella sp.]HET6555342.1 nitrilase-related carbon-nitrogen hydrolase [Dyella sp.]
MASGHKGFLPLAWTAATALSALGWWFGSGLQPQWWLTWLAPLPVLWLASRARALWVALAALLAYAIGGLNQWLYMHQVIRLPLSVIVCATVLPGVALALCALLFRGLLLRGRVLAAVLVVPSAWVTVEYIGSLLSPHGTFGNISYTQMDNLPIVQVAAIAGIWGIGFLLWLLPTAIAALLATQATKRERILVAIITVLPIAAAVAYGTWRLQVPGETSVRIGLVSLEKPIRPALEDADGQALQARYVKTVEHLAGAGAKVVLMPETSFSSQSATVPAFAALAAQHGVTLGIGIDARSDPQAERNTLAVYRPGEAAPITYSKHHLIPGLERQYTPGNHYTLLDGAPRVGLAVCKDMDFHDIGQAYAARRVQLLLVPAWDFGVDGWLHSRMAIMRGVESGFAIARVARSGRLTLSDDRGRVVAESSSEDHDETLVGDLFLRDTSTLYGRWGDWWAWLCLVGAAGCVALYFLRRRAIS